MKVCCHRAGKVTAKETEGDAELTPGLRPRALQRGLVHRAPRRLSDTHKVWPV